MKSTLNTLLLPLAVALALSACTQEQAAAPASQGVRHLCAGPATYRRHCAVEPFRFFQPFAAFWSG